MAVIPIFAYGAYFSAALLMAIAVYVIKTKGFDWTTLSLASFTFFKALFLISQTSYHYVGSLFLATFLSHLEMASIFMYSASILMFPLNFRKAGVEIVLTVLAIGVVFAFVPFGFEIKESIELTETGYVTKISEWFFYLMQSFMITAYSAGAGVFLWMSTQTRSPETEKKLITIALIALSDLAVSSGMYFYTGLVGHNAYVSIIQGISFPVIFGLLLYVFLKQEKS